MSLSSQGLRSERSKCMFETKYFEFSHFTDSRDWFVHVLLRVYVLESGNTELFLDILCFIVTDRLLEIMLYLNCIV